MEQEHNHSGRLMLIGFVLLVALVSIFWPGLYPNPARLFSPSVPWTDKLNLKPGIDMVGGTSLLYEIKPPEGGSLADASGTLAEKMTEALKRRIDPDGRKNLVWRPQGTNRLEIQLPGSANRGEADKYREAFVQAGAALDATNVRRGEVVTAVETLTGDARAQRLNELADGDPQAALLFTRLAKAYDQLADARRRHDDDAEAKSSITYDALQKQIEDDNLAGPDLQSTLDAPADEKTKQLGELKTKYVSWPARLAAVDQYAFAYGQYEKVKDQIDSTADLKRQLKGSGMLEFHILASEADLASPAGRDMLDRLNGKEGPAVHADDTLRWFQIDRPDQFGYKNLVFTHNGKAYALAWTTPERSMVNRPGETDWALESAFPTADPNGSRAVGFAFDPGGAKEFNRLTSGNLNTTLGAILDGRVVSAANINSAISANGIISAGRNGWSDEEYRYLINTLNAGSLPAQLADDPIREQTVGPQLGQDNLKRGLLACAFGLVVVAVFLIFYYHLAGVIATGAVFMNVVLILGTMSLWGATFTLPGIAGIVLTIAAAVDANVLTFERLREEQLRGMGLRIALHNAYNRAASAIVDSNATTVITSLILYWLGSEEVRGFGITLLIGLIWSLFTALFVTRTVFDLMVDKFGLRKLGSLPLTIPAWDRLMHPRIDWMSKAWMFASVSAVLIVAGLAAFAVKMHAGEMLDIEFSKGTSVQFAMTGAGLPIEQVRSMLEHADAAALPSPSVQSVGTDNKTYEVVTPNEDANQVRQAVIAAMGDKLDVTLPSGYAAVGKTVDDAVKAGAIVPIESADLAVDGFKVPGAATYQGGAAIVLRGLNPPLTVGDITDRIKREELQPQAGTAAAAPPSGYPDFAVVADAPASQKVSTAIMLLAPGELTYDKDQAKWRDGLVSPMWALLADAVNKPATLQGVRSIGPSIAGDTQEAALGALCLSVVVILLYIWVRFGNLKYGTATVVAMLHDTLIAVGALGLAHYISAYAPGLAKVLLIEPFRINMTLVAAVLTTMSYSMIDTIVVFDRVRENRGKYGHLSRQVVNDSINQTLSRTLLTAGITTVTLLGMYLFGGPGIHGFTYVMLIGIIVGTYSSVAVAAPILLFGRERETRANEPPTTQRAQFSAV